MEKLKNNKKRFCFAMMKIMTIILLFNGCLSDSIKSVSKFEAEKLESFISSFYKFMDYYNEAEFESVKQWYLETKIMVYSKNAENNYRVGIPLGNIDDYDFDKISNEWNFFISDFSAKYGKREKQELTSVYFVQNAYDIPLHDFFFLEYFVSYEKGDTLEMFSIKKDGEQYKLVQYFIDVNPCNRNEILKHQKILINTSNVS